MGSIPFGLILSYFFKKEDPRKMGSKNIGATNILRVNGWKLGSLTLILDILKAFIPVKLCSMFKPELIPLVSVLIFFGHLFPVWLRFKGGKGIAVFIGILFGISKILGLIFLISWLFIALIFKYSSLAAIISSVLVYCFVLLKNYDSLNFLILFLNIMIFYKHKDNISRILKNTESKIKFKK